MKEYLEKVDAYIAEQAELPVTAGTLERMRDVLRYRSEIAECAAKMKRGHSGDAEELSKQEAEEWVSGMKNADGSSGAHWSMEQTEQVRKAQSIHADPVEFWVSMNMMYSDYGPAAKKFNITSPEFFAALAAAFLDDPDAPSGKLARYHKAMQD